MKNDDIFYYQNQDKKAWLGQGRVFAVKGRDISIFANGGIKKVPRCNIQLCESEDEEIDEEKEDSKEVKKNKKSVSIGELPEGFSGENRRITRSMTEEERQELERDQIATFWMKLENHECFDDISVYTVEVPVREHKTPEVIEAKENEIKNLEKYGVF